MPKKPNVTPAGPEKLVTYRRVSTVRQGESGLGLEAQVSAIERYRASRGCTTIAEYTEIETGKKDEMENRPELLKAIAHAQRAGARLVIAKLDRLARSVYVPGSTSLPATIPMRGALRFRSWRPSPRTRPG
jgi:DNA invertase Pin-like site-specific DNA recombinase